jgi:hypothetical protein
VLSTSGSCAPVHRDFSSWASMTNLSPLAGPDRTVTWIGCFGKQAIDKRTQKASHRPVALSPEAAGYYASVGTVLS